MPFTRKTLYAGDGKYRRARRSDSTLPTTPGPINIDREKQLADLFREAVTTTLAQPNVQFTHLTKLLDAPLGHLTIVENFPWDVFETVFRQAERQLVDQLADAGTLEAQEMNMGPFDRRDPNVLIYGAKHAADMVTHITAEQRRNLRNLVMTSELGGIAPKTLAHDIRNIVGLTPKWAGAVTKYQRGMVDQGTDPAFAAKQARKYHARLLTARANMIARTEIMRAQNEGKVLGWKQAISNGLLTPGGQKQWHTAITNVCPVCLPMDKRAVGLDDEFTLVTEQRRIYHASVPPAHPHCRCTVVYVPPTIEDMTGGLSLDDLIADIQQGTYVPDVDSDAFPDPEEGLDYRPLRVVNEIDEPAAEFTIKPVDEVQEARRTAFLTDELYLDSTEISDPPASFATTREAEQWMRDNMGQTGIVRMDHQPGRQLGEIPNFSLTPRLIDFEDLTSVLAQTMVTTAVAFARRYPNSWARLTGYGTVQALYRNDSNLRDIPVPAKTYAQVANAFDSSSRTLGWNKLWGTKTRLAKYVQSFWADTVSNWHPSYDSARFNPVTVTLAHEFVHVIHNRINDIDPLGWGPRLRVMIAEETGLNSSQVSLNDAHFLSLVEEQVSRYAVSDWQEFVAEALTAYRTQSQSISQQTPLVRAVARWVAHYGDKGLL